MGLLMNVMKKLVLGLTSMIAKNLSLDLSILRKITGSAVAVLLVCITLGELVTRIEEMGRLRNERSLKKHMN